MANILLSDDSEFLKHFAYDPARGLLTPLDDFFKIIDEAPDYAISREGMIVRIKQMNRTRVGKVLKPYALNGYPAIVLRNEGILVRRLVHRLVCSAFHGPQPTPSHEVAHIDGTRSNCTANNLRWSTHVDNEADKIVHGTKPKRTHAKLTEQDVMDIRAAPMGWGASRKLAEKYGVAHQTISRVRLGQSWQAV